MKKTQIIKTIATAIVMFMPLAATAQSAAAPPPCPDVKINERYDQVSRYHNSGWDTVVNCVNNGLIVLTAEPYIPPQYFNGTYKVEQIPYNPPDTTFYLNYNPATDANNPLKKKLAITNDDDWAPSYVNIAFPFYFFGIRKNKFLLGDNGIVTFATPSGYSGGGECPYSTTTALPWSSAVPNTPSCDPALMRDAIYGVYEDTYTGSNGSYMSGNQGIYYGVLDDFPCRKIIASWNDIPVFSNQNMRQTYQIVCYEGSNIVEVHVKKRNCCPSTNGGNGLIGIQNATGLPQVRGSVGSPNMYVESGKPAAFWPNGYNVFRTALDSVAFRFTPLGETMRTLQWYRIFDDGRDSIMLTTNVNDPNGYYIPMHDKPSDPNYDSIHPTLTKAFIRTNEPSRYVLCLRFQNANEDWYILRDTISIGVDTVKSLALKSITTLPDTARRIDICNGQTTAMRLHCANNIDSIRWRVERILNGRRITLPASMYELQDNDKMIVIKPDPQYDTLPLNHIDSIRVMGVVDFSNRCSNFDTFLVRVYPIFDTTDVAGICSGDKYYWQADGNYYTETTTLPVTHLQSTPGCDSTVHLHLTVYDVSYNIDHQETCREFVWRNGRTYTESNWATALTDTVRMQNRYGCDSIVQLELVVYPLKARIQSNVDEFTYDNMEAMLDDISTGSSGHVWLLPVGKDANGDTIKRQSSDATVYYTIPDSISEACIWLIAESPYGCLDTAYLYLPMHKQTIYVPTAFMPDNAEGNNIFRSQSLNVEMQEMWVYDRAGRVVAHCSGVDCGWDGRDLNGNPCPQAAYVYIINYTTKDKPRQTQSAHGTVTLIR